MTVHSNIHEHRHHRAAESTGGLLYLVMRLLPGRSLEDRIAEGKLPAAEAARIALECAQALAAAHAVGVVHRDIKPGNILLDANGNATVTDFGIALVTSRPARELPGSTADPMPSARTAGRDGIPTTVSLYVR